MSIRLIHNDVLVRESKPERKGIIEIPVGYRPKYLYGQVITVGPGHYQDGVLIPTPVDVGQIVMFESVYEKLDIDGESLMLVASRDIVGIVG